jgi:hypothetical protein
MLASSSSSLSIDHSFVFFFFLNVSYYTVQKKGNCSKIRLISTNKIEKEREREEKKNAKEKKKDICMNEGRYIGTRKRNLRMCKCL